VKQIFNSRPDCRFKILMKNPEKLLSSYIYWFVTDNIYSPYTHLKWFQTLWDTRLDPWVFKNIKLWLVFLRVCNTKQKLCIWVQHFTMHCDSNYSNAHWKVLSHKNIIRRSWTEHTKLKATKQLKALLKRKPKEEQDKKFVLFHHGMPRHNFFGFCR
jgi:hypothetical protein